MYAKSILLFVLTSKFFNSDGFLGLSGQTKRHGLRMADNHHEKEEVGESAQSKGFSRRSILGFALAAPCLLTNQKANAKDEIFKSNPLTNGLLEQVSPRKFHV
jgi:hypothetical protein